MKQTSSLILFLTFVLVAQSQIVVNEVIFTPTPAVEVKNLGPSTVDVSTLQLCSFPVYNELQNLTLVSGNLMLGPGEFLVVSGHNFGTTDDEIGLYTGAPYDDPDNILHYVEWGSPGHFRSNTAIAAGVWTNANFVNVDAGGASIEYDGEGFAASDWLLNGTSSPGEENSNVGGGCEASAFVVGSQAICEGNSATFQLILTGIGPWTFTYSMDGVLQDPITTDLSPYPWMLSEEGSYDLMAVSDSNCDGDANGSVSVSFISPPTATLSGATDICPSDPDASLTVDFTGQGPWTFDFAIDGTAQGEVTTGDNPTGIPVSSEGEYTLVSIDNGGCDGSVSGSVAVVYSVYGGDLSQQGSTADITICVDDEFPDPATFDVVDAVGDDTEIVVTDETGVVISLPGTNVIDFDGSEAGTCLVWNISSLDGLTGLVVGAQVPNDLTGCYAISNPITVIRQTGMDCTTGIEEFDGLQDLTLYPNPVTDQLSISYTLDERASLSFTVIDLTGKTILTNASVSTGGSDIVRLDVSNLSSGAYILQMTSVEGEHVQRMFMK